MIMFCCVGPYYNNFQFMRHVWSANLYGNHRLDGHSKMSKYHNYNQNQVIFAKEYTLNNKVISSAFLKIKNEFANENIIKDII
jgi:hypothetical protein